MVKIQSGDGMYHKDPEINAKLESISFIWLKLRHLERRVKQEQEKLKKEILVSASDFIKKKKEELKGKKTSSNEIKITLTYKNVTGDIPFFFYLDSFLIDSKRAIEFSLKLLAIAEKIKINNKFSLDKILNQLEAPKSNFTKMVFRKYKNYYRFLISNRPWLRDLNKRRTGSMHENVAKKSGAISVDFVWSSVKSLDDDPEITFPNIVMFKKPVHLFIKEELDKIAIFLGSTLDLRKDLSESFDSLINYSQKHPI